VAVKKTAYGMGLAGGELKKLIETLDREEINLGETAGPLLDLYETAEHIMIEVDLPGINADDVGIYFLNGLLTIEGGVREREDCPGRINYLCVERSFDAFRRVIRIAVPVNPHGAGASYSMGVLTVSFPKVLEKRGQAIKIPVNKGND